MQSYRICSVLAGALFLVAPVVRAQTVERPTDSQVKKVIEAVDQTRDRFEDQLDGKVKNGVIRSATGEVQVKGALEDFQKEVATLKSRFTDSYAASSEVETLLRRGNALDAMVKGQPTGLKGASEWDQVAAELKRLAAAYRTEFPLPEGAAVRRINDAEAAAFAAAIATQAEQVKRAVNADKTMAKPDKQALTADVEAVIKQAKLLESRLKDGKPATADGRALREKLAALLAEGRQLPPSVLSAIGSLRAPTQKLEMAFGAFAPATK
jgi:hypothetical protein